MSATRTNVQNAGLSLKNAGRQSDTMGMSYSITRTKSMTFRRTHTGKRSALEMVALLNGELEVTKYLYVVHYVETASALYALATLNATVPTETH